MSPCFGFPWKYSERKDDGHFCADAALLPVVKVRFESRSPRTEKVINILAKTGLFREGNFHRSEDLYMPDVVGRRYVVHMK